MARMSRWGFPGRAASASPAPSARLVNRGVFSAVFVTAGFMLAGREASAQATAVAVSGTSYDQNFNSMPNSSSASLPGGWSFFRSGTSSVPPNYSLSGSNATVVGAAAGSQGTNPTAGAAYQWVTGSAATGTDKAIGFLSSGSYPGTTSAAPGQSLAILFGFTNTTGGVITTLDLAWDYEKYRSGTRVMNWNFYSSSDGSTWTANSAGDQNYAADANTTTLLNPPQVNSKALSLSGLSVANGSSYYLRWSYVTTGSWSNAQGLGFDNFTMNLTTSGGGPTDLYWDGGSWAASGPGTGGSGSWATGSGSWDQTQKANFGGTAGTVTVDSVTAANGLAFTTPGYTLSGGTVTLAGASIGVNTITTGTDDTVTATIDSTLAGSAGMMKMGPGTLVLGGANTFSGGLTVSSGTLQIASDANLGDAANAVSLNGTLKTTGNLSLGSGRGITGGASLDIAPATTLTVGGSYATASTTLLNAGTLDLQGSTRSVGTLTFGTAATVNGSGGLTVAGITATAVTSGSAVVNPAITFASGGDKTVDVGSGGTLVLAGDIAGTTGRITKTGAGTLVASGSNSTSGYRVGAAGSSPTNGGTVMLGAAAASGTGQLQLNYGTLQTTDPFTFANGLSVGGRTGAVAVLGGSNATTFSGTSSFFRATATSGELRLDVNNDTTLGPFSATSGGGTATGITIGGTGSLTFGGDASLLTDAITLQDGLDLLVSGTVGSTGVTVGSGNLIGGDGTIVGTLSLAAGADFLFDVGKTLTVNGATVSFGDFGISDLIGFSAAVPDGSYTLIDGLANIDTTNLRNFGPANALSLGDGRSAYFTEGSLVLQVVPEPSSLLFAAVGLGLGALRRLRRRA